MASFWRFSVCSVSVLLWHELAAEPINVEIAAYGNIFPDNLGSLPYCAPLQDAAVDDMNRQFAGKFRFKVTYLFDRRFRCDTLADNAVNLVSRWYYRERPAGSIPAVLFPGCSPGEAPALNPLSANLNMPLMTSIANDDSIRNKAISPTFVSFAHLSPSVYNEFLATIAKLYSWSSVFVVVDQTSVPIYFFLSGSVKAGFSTAPNSQINIRPAKDAEPSTYRQLLLEFHKVSRVLVFLGRTEHLRTFLIEAHKQDMTNGDYVYVVVENFIYKQLYGLMQWQIGDENDKIVKQAYRSLLIVRPVDFNDTIQFSNSSVLTQEDITLRARRDYNFSLPIADQPQGNFAATYAPIVIFAQTLNASYEQYGATSLFDGRLLTSMMLNKTFSTTLGPVAIDPVGERRVDLSLWQYLTDDDILVPFLRKNAMTGKVTELRNVSWIEGKSWPPPNEPRCGYAGNGLKCLVHTDMSSVLLPALCSVLILIMTLTVAAYVKWRRSHDAAKERWWAIQPDVIGVRSTHFSHKLKGNSLRESRHTAAWQEAKSTWSNQKEQPTVTGRFTSASYGHID